MVSRELEDCWSREQIAAGLRLVASGVPVEEVIHMMSVSLEVFSAWKAEYAALFETLIIKPAGFKKLKNANKMVGSGRIAYLSACVDDREVESELRSCKLRYSVLENVTAVAAELLKSGSILGSVQKPIYWQTVPETQRPPLERSLGRTLQMNISPLSDSKLEQMSEKQEREIGSSQASQTGEKLLILVSAQIANPRKDSSQHERFRGAVALSGILSGQIDQLRWQGYSKERGQTDEPILLNIGLKFSLDGIFDALIDAIRTFYTSPMDALLLGNILIKKSESPVRRV